MTRGRVPTVWALEEDLHLPLKDAAWRSSRFFYSKQGGGNESERGRNSSGHRGRIWSIMVYVPRVLRLSVLYSL